MWANYGWWAGFKFLNLAWRTSEYPFVAQTVKRFAHLWSNCTESELSDETLPICCALKPTSPAKVLLLFKQTNKHAQPLTASMFHTTDEAGMKASLNLAVNCRLQLLGNWWYVRWSDTSWRSAPVFPFTSCVLWPFEPLPSPLGLALAWKQNSILKVHREEAGVLKEVTSTSCDGSWGSSEENLWPDRTFAIQGRCCFFSMCILKFRKT